MMASAQIQQLHDAGMEIGGHTLTHPILASIDDAAARTEIAEDKVKLEASSVHPCTCSPTRTVNREKIICLHT